MFKQSRIWWFCCFHYIFSHVTIIRKKVANLNVISMHSFVLSETDVKPLPLPHFQFLPVLLNTVYISSVSSVAFLSLLCCIITMSLCRSAFVNRNDPSNSGLLCFRLIFAFTILTTTTKVIVLRFVVKTIMGFLVNLS